MTRVTSSIFVSALMRRVQGKGGFAAILRKGADQAGAINIVMRGRNGEIALYQPASQFAANPEGVRERAFYRSPQISSDETLDAFVKSETRFDPDFWLVELDFGDMEPGDLFKVMTL